MGEQKTQASQPANTNQNHPLKREVEFEKRPATFFGSSVASLGTGAPAWPDSPPTSQQILASQRTIGNRATQRLLSRHQEEFGKHEDMEGRGRSGMIDRSSSIRAYSTGISLPQQVSEPAMQAKGEGQAGETDGCHGIGPPQKATLLDVQSRRENVYQLGVTNHPTGFRAPTFEFNSTNKDTSGKEQWYANPSLETEACEGQAESIYVGECSNEPSHVEDGKQVYVNLSAEIASLNQQAEQEHCKDFMFAYEISLKKAETALKMVEGKAFGPEKTQDRVEKKVLKEIHAHLHPKQKVLQDTKETSRGWASDYDDLCWLTKTRDDKNWHSFDNKDRTEGEKVIRDITIGATRIGHKSDEIIEYSKIP